MANWRKQQGQSHHHQVGQWRPFSHRKPPLDNRHSTVPAWEKKFCASIGLVSWRKLVESKQYMYLFENVVRWDDSAVKEAFDNAKMRYWAGINGVSCDISMPDPDIYNGNIDWNATVDPELIQDLEEAKVYNEEQKDEEIVYVDGKLFKNQQQVPPTGWGDDEGEQPKPCDPTLAPQGWGSPAHENTGVESGQQQYGAPVEHSWGWGWNHYNHSWGWEWNHNNDSWGLNHNHDSLGWNYNDSWGLNHREHNSGDMHKMGRGRSGGGYGNWGTTSWDGYNRKRENMSWARTPNAYNGNNEYHHMNRRRRNNRGGRGRGNFVYVPKEVPTSAAW